MIRVRRHALLVVEPEIWNEQVREHEIPEVRGWAEKGWPLICRRSMPGEQGGIALGLPLPPSMGKQRLRFNLPADGVRPYSGTALLSDHAGCPALSENRRKDVEVLLAIGKQYGITPEIAGSLLWASITGLPYLSERSDLDVLWPVVRHDIDLSGLLKTLHQHESAFSMRLDGEVIFPGGLAVQWHELLSALMIGDDEMVMVKSLDQVELIPVSALLKISGKVTCDA